MVVGTSTSNHSLHEFKRSNKMSSRWFVNSNTKREQSNKIQKKINGIVYKTLNNAAMFLRSQKLYSTIKVSITLKKA